MKVKICGLKERDNIINIVNLKPTFIGLIFYNRSKRYIKNLDSSFIRDIKGVKKVGVFVNSTIENIIKNVEEYSLDYVQLHGDENPIFCKELKSHKIDIFKVFAVGDKFNFSSLAEYEEHIDYFLFDTKGDERGGNGIKFNWDILINNYKSNKPFILSGGISLDDITTLKCINHPKLYAIDVNSKFELEPGVKNIDDCKQLISKIETLTHND